MRALNARAFQVIREAARNHRSGGKILPTIPFGNTSPQAPSGFGTDDQWSFVHQRFGPAESPFSSAYGRVTGVSGLGPVSDLNHQSDGLIVRDG